MAMNIDENKIRETVANASLDDIYGLIVELGIISPEVVTKDDWDIICQMIDSHPEASIEEITALFLSYKEYKKYRK